MSRPVAVRLLDQRAVAVRHGPRNRDPRRRRHCRDRECRADHTRGRARSARGDPQGNGPDHRRDRGHHPGADRGVRADGLLPRIDRRDLSPVLGHAGHFDLLLRRAGPVADPGAVRHLPAEGRRPGSRRCSRARRCRSTAARWLARTAGSGPRGIGAVLPPLQSVVCADDREVRSHQRGDPCPADPRAGGVPPAGRDHRPAVRAPAGRVPAHRGPGLCHHRGPVARRVDPRTAGRGN